MQWTRYVDTDNGIVQWVDFDASNAWFDVAVERSTDAEIRRLDGRPWGEQWRATVAAWDAYSRAFRSLTLPWYDPAVTELQAGDQRAWRGLLDTNMHRSGEGGFTYSIATRCYLVPATSALETQCMSDAPRTGEGCDFDGLFSGCMQEGADHGGCDPYSWDTIAWKGGFATSELDVLPPARWFMQRVQRFAASAKARGARQVLIDTRLNIVLRNLAEARRVGVEFPEDLAVAAARLPADLEAARWNDPRIREAASYFSATAAAVAAANPIAGAVVGAVGAVASALPGAVGSDPAHTPVYTRPWIPGTGPTAGNPPPPSFDPNYPADRRRPTYLSAVLVPGFGAPAPAAGGDGGSGTVVDVPGLTLTPYPGGSTGAPVARQEASSSGSSAAIAAVAVGAGLWALSQRKGARGGRRGRR
jgi:hypothetical protein